MQFPAVADEDFYEALQSGGTYHGDGTVQLPLSYTKRVQAATENLVAVALEFRAIVENVLQILIGCPLDFQPGTNSKQVRTWSFMSKASNSPHHKGVFGHTRAFFGCVETQARGALHFHAIIWGGIKPKLLEHATSIPAVCQAVQRALDKMFSAQIP